jgi:hypothetical protein
MTHNHRRADPRRSPHVSGAGVLLSRACAALFAVLLVGCTGIPAPTVCYQITGATVHAVDTGMSVAGDLYRAGKITDAQKSKLVAAHDIYRPTAQAAVAGCKVVQNQGDIDKVVAGLKTASDKLIEALVAAGVLR